MKRNLSAYSHNTSVCHKTSVTLRCIPKSASCCLALHCFSMLYTTQCNVTATANSPSHWVIIIDCEKNILSYFIELIKLHAVPLHALSRTWKFTVILILSLILIVIVIISYNPNNLVDNYGYVGLDFWHFCSSWYNVCTLRSHPLKHIHWVYSQSSH